MDMAWEWDVSTTRTQCKWSNTDIGNKKSLQKLTALWFHQTYKQNLNVTHKPQTPIIHNICIVDDVNYYIIAWTDLPCNFICPFFYFFRDLCPKCLNCNTVFAAHRHTDTRGATRYYDRVRPTAIDGRFRCTRERLIFECQLQTEIISSWFPFAWHRLRTELEMHNLVHRLHVSACFVCEIMDNVKK